MFTRDVLKNEIDRLPERYFRVLYRLIQSLKPSTLSNDVNGSQDTQKQEWQRFVRDMYGAIKDESFERAPQGELEFREAFE